MWCALVGAVSRCTWDRFWESTADRRGQGSRDFPCEPPTSWHVHPAPPVSGGNVSLRECVKHLTRFTARFCPPPHNLEDCSFADLSPEDDMLSLPVFEEAVVLHGGD